MTTASEAKNRGNAFFSQQKWNEAIEEYTTAIKLDPSGSTSHTYFSNRSACFAEKGEFDKALQDAEECVKLQPSFAKGYSRKGYALYKLNRVEEAKKTYNEGLKVDPNNESLKEGLKQCQPQPRGLFGPEIWMTIHSDPELKEYAKDKDFVMKVNMLQQNPQIAMQMGLLQDQKIQKLFGKLLGNLNVGGEGDTPMESEAHGDDDHAHSHDDHDHDHSHDHSHDHNHDHSHDHSHSHAHPNEPKTSKNTFEHEEKSASTKPNSAPQEEKPEIASLPKADPEKAKEAASHKKKGNELYQEKRLDEALQEYQKAFELDPYKPEYLLNQSAVTFMKEQWDETIALCEKAINLCRERFADLQWTFKAYNRMGSVEEKRNNIAQAVNYYKKALVEQKDEKLRKKVKLLEETIKKDKEKEYLDPAKGEEHREKGNELFKQGKFHESIKEYSESIRRKPDDPRVYSNRAAAFCKIMAWNDALKDSDKAIELDPQFVKAYIRKGKVLTVLGQYHKALEVLKKAEAIDPNAPDLKEAHQETMTAIHRRNASGEVDEAARQRALQDPDVQAAMNDPEVSSVLLQAQSGDPSILFRAMRDRPHIAEKIQTLMAAGVLQMK